jgi:hypothetical protein
VGAARRSGFVMDGVPTLGNLWHTGIQSFRAARCTFTPASKLAGDPDTPACGSKVAPVGAALYAETEVSAYLEAGLRQSGSVLRTRRFSQAYAAGERGSPYAPTQAGIGRAFSA